MPHLVSEWPKVAHGGGEFAVATAFGRNCASTALLPPMPLPPGAHPAPNRNSGVSLERSENAVLAQARNLGIALGTANEERVATAEAGPFNPASRRISGRSWPRVGRFCWRSSSSASSGISSTYPGAMATLRPS